MVPSRDFLDGERFPTSRISAVDHVLKGPYPGARGESGMTRVRCQEVDAHSGTVSATRQEVVNIGTAVNLLTCGGPPLPICVNRLTCGAPARRPAAGWVGTRHRVGISTPCRPFGG